MNETKTTKSERMIGYINVELETEVIDGKNGDTSVSMNNHLLCWISGSTIDEFMHKLEHLVDKYRI